MKSLVAVLFVEFGRHMKIECDGLSEGREFHCFGSTITRSSVGQGFFLLGNIRSLFLRFQADFRLPLNGNPFKYFINILPLIVLRRGQGSAGRSELSRRNLAAPPLWTGRGGKKTSKILITIHHHDRWDRCKLGRVSLGSLARFSRSVLSVGSLGLFSRFVLSAPSSPLLVLLRLASITGNDVKGALTHTH